MSHHLELSDALFQRLSVEAERRGLSGVEALLEVWVPPKVNESHATVVSEIIEFRNRMAAQYGVAEDSVTLIQADRMR